MLVLHINFMTTVRTDNSCVSNATQQCEIALLPQ